MTIQPQGLGWLIALLVLIAACVLLLLYFVAPPLALHLGWLYLALIAALAVSRLVA